MGTGDARFRFYSVEELDELPDPEWLIEPILPKGGLAELYGEIGKGKSFVALHWALSLTAGLVESTTHSGPLDVIYVCAEGGRGIKKRIAAWGARHPNADLSKFRVLPLPVDMLSAKDVKALVRAIREISENPALIVIDTLARCFGAGDENMAKDMNSFVASCWSIIRAFPDATVLVIHHTGKNTSRGDRGSTALRAACDTVIKLQRSDNTLSLICEKQKDWEPFEAMGFKLEVVQLAEGESSCVITPSKAKRSIDGKNKGDLIESGLQALKSLDLLGKQGATAKEWLASLKAGTGNSGSTFFRSRKVLEDGGYIKRTRRGRGSRYTLTQKGKKAVTVK